MKRIAVLLTVHNRKESTLRCLRNVEAQVFDRNESSIEIYITDDGCTDGTREAVISEFKDAHVINGDGTLFWNRGMVAAWREAAKGDYDYYLWLNDDTFLYQDTVRRLLESSGRHGDGGVIVGATCAVGHPEEITYGGWIGGEVVRDVSVEHRCETFNGNIVLVPRAVYEVLGTNDPYYRHAVGDTDYGLRAGENGIEVWQAAGLMGECDKHERPAVWMDPSQPFSKRRKNFYSPTGNNPFEFFHFRRRHYGLIPACRTFVTNYLHFLFPRLWRKSYSGYQSR